jgi:hypothetical protein
MQYNFGKKGVFFKLLSRRDAKGDEDQIGEGYRIRQESEPGTSM